MNPIQFINRDRLSVITGAILLSLALSRLVELPTRPIFTLMAFGSPVGVHLSSTNLVQLILAGLSLTGSISLVRLHPFTQQSGERPYLFWIIPGLLGIGLGTWLSQIQDLASWVVALVVCAVLVPLMLTIEYNALDPLTRKTPLMVWAQQAMVYGTAVLWFVLIYEARLRSLLSGTAVFFIGTVLAMRLLWLHHGLFIKAFQQSLLIGLGVAQLVWVLNYGRLLGIQGGLCLFLLFYVLMGIIQQTINGQWDDGQNGRRILLEYGGIAVIALLFIFWVLP